jgi:hypothetical protein
MLIFADGGAGSGSGTFTIDAAYFTKVAPTMTNVYDFTPASGWTSGDTGVYTFTPSGASTTVDYNKGTGQEWSYMMYTFNATDVQGYNTMTLVLQGTSGDTLLLKPNNDNGLQQDFTFDGTEQTVVLTADSFSSMYIFADPGNTPSTGTFTIVSAQLSYIEPHYMFLTGWTSGDAGVYTFTDDTTGTIVDYTKATGQEWSYMSNVFDPTLSAGFNTLTITVQGTSGDSILLKPNDDNNLQQTITFDGTEQTFTFSADSFTKMLIFADPGNAPSTGTFTITAAKLTYVKPAPLPANQTYDMQNGWVDNDGGIYTFTNNSGVVTVDYTRTSTQNWSFIVNNFPDELQNFNTITITVQGTSGMGLIIKPNDNGAYEQDITLDGTAQTFTFTLTDIPKKVLIFVDPNNASLTGSFDIISATVTSSDPNNINFINGFKENDPGTYAFTPNADGSVQVDYTKATGQEWSFMSATFDQNALYGQNTIIIKIQGTSGDSILVKPNNDSNLQQTITFDGTVQTITVTSDTLQSLLIFADPGNAPSTGTFTIMSARLTYVEPGYAFAAASNWTSGDAGVYTFTDDSTGTIVDFTKTTGQEWSYMGDTFNSTDVAGYNTLTIILNGASGTELLLKPNDDSNLQMNVTLDGTDQTFTFTATAFIKMLIFAAPGTTPATGSFTIVDARLTYVEPQAVPAYQDYPLGNNWVDNDGGIYTFTDNAGVITVDYTRTSTQNWSYIKYDIPDNLLYHDVLTMEFQGTAGAQIIVKPNNDGALEQTLTFDGTVQTLTFNLTSTLTTILIFVDPTNASLTGSFDIVSAVVTSTHATLDFTQSFAENDPGTYAFTTNEDNSVTVDYTKGVDQTYTYMIADFSNDMVTGLNTMTIVIQGPSGTTLLLKPNDDGGLQQNVTLDGTAQTFTFTTTSFTKMLIFADPGNAPTTGTITGTFTILGAVLSHVE